MKCEQSKPKDPWEHIDSRTSRMEVAGGWLYRYDWSGVAMCFVPYPPADTPVNPGWTVVG